MRTQKRPTRAKAGNEALPSFPRAGFGDFRMAIMTHPETDPHNSFAYSQAFEGTPRSKAPEQVLFRSKRTLLPSERHHGKMSFKTNIWGIGAIMIRLMNRGAEGSRKHSKSPSHEHGKEEARSLFASAWRAILQEFGELAQRCCGFSPDKRPGLEVLRAELEKLMCDDEEESRWNGLNDDEEMGIKLKPVGKGFGIGNKRERDEEGAEEK